MIYSRQQKGRETKKCTKEIISVINTWLHILSPRPKLFALVQILEFSLIKFA